MLLKWREKIKDRDSSFDRSRNIVNIRITVSFASSVVSKNIVALNCLDSDSDPVERQGDGNSFRQRLRPRRTRHPDGSTPQI